MDVNFFIGFEVTDETWSEARVFNYELNFFTAQAFHVFGPSHVTVLFLTMFVAVIMLRTAHMAESVLLRTAERLLALVLLLEWPCNLLLSWWAGELGIDHVLPAHFCDVAAVLGGLALLTKKHELCELTYFWGLAGTAQGMLTPALEVDFPDPRFFTFFALHSGVVIAALHLVLGRRITPRRGAVGRALAWMLVYAAAAGGVNAATGSNYGFLCRKPPTASLLDVLGPWPWYLGSLVIIALVLFTLLDLPFRHGRKG
jgi:hypothetical integral membrane protein (TIGR02206 family)